MQDFAHTIAAWLSAQLPGVPPVEIVDTTEPAQGFSSRTILFTARWREEECPLVARIQRDVAVPMLADVFHQHRVMTAIAANSAVKVPIIAFTENDPAIVGAPFFIMERLYGRVPSDFPSYHQQGWFADLPPVKTGDLDGFLQGSVEYTRGRLGDLGQGLPVRPAAGGPA